MTKQSYTSSIRIFGLPLFEYRGGEIVDGFYCRGVARAWVAVGDVAFGVLFAAGGVAMGGVAVGGLSIGLLPIGGLALGAFALGGCAGGVWAVGGAAFGLQAALGGLAVAGQYAEGGLAIAPHANNQAASEFFTGTFFRTSKAALRWSWLLIALPSIMVLASRLRREG
jgi:hypothetical protein